MSSTSRILWWGLGIGLFVAIYGLFIQYALFSIWGFGLLGIPVLDIFDPVSFLFRIVIPEFPNGTLYGNSFNLLFYGLHVVVGFAIGIIGSWLYERASSKVFKTSPPSTIPGIVLALTIVGYAAIVAALYLSVS